MVPQTPEYGRFICSVIEIQALPVTPERHLIKWAKTWEIYYFSPAFCYNKIFSIFLRIFILEGAECFDDLIAGSGVWCDKLQTCAKMKSLVIFYL